MLVGGQEVLKALLVGLCARRMQDTRKRAREQEGDDGRKCFVYNLPWDVDWQDLKRHFKPAGQVMYAGVIKEKGPTGNFTGRSKGCGIVEFETVEQAIQAISLFNGTEMGGRTIYVRRDIEDPKQRTFEHGAGPKADEHAKRGRNNYDGASQGMEMQSVGTLPVGGGRYRDDVYAAAGYVDRAAYDIAAAAAMPPVAAGQMGYDLGVDMGYNMRGAASGSAYQQDPNYQARMEYALGGQAVQGYEMAGHAPSGYGVARQGYHDHHAVSGSAGQHVAQVGRKVFVSNLNYETTWQQLKDHFKTVGPVTYCTILKDKEGKSKGLGIVEFEAPGDALRAISRLSNSVLHDRQITVREDQHDQELQHDHHGPPSIGYRAKYDVDYTELAKKKRTCQVVVHGLPYSYEDLQLRDMFRAIGYVVKCQVIKDQNGRSRGWGTVLFDNEECASRAIAQFNGVQLHGRVISVKLDEKA